MATYFHQSFIDKHLWIVESKVSDLNHMVDEAIRTFENRNVRISTLLICNPGEAEQVRAVVNKAPGTEAIPVELKHGIGVEVDENVYNVYEYPKFKVSAFKQGGHKYIHHLHGMHGGQWVKNVPGPYWLAFVGPLWKDGGTSGPAVPPPPKPQLGPTQTGPAVKSWSQIAVGK